MIKPPPLFALSFGDVSRLKKRQKVLVHAPRKRLAIIAFFILYQFGYQLLPASAEPVFLAHRQRTDNLEGICIEKSRGGIVTLHIAQYRVL